MVRLVGLALNPEFAQRAERIVKRFAERAGRPAGFSVADVKALARAIGKGASVEDYRLRPAPTTAEVIDWIRSLVTGTTAEDCTNLAVDLAEGFGGMVQMKWPAAPGTPAATAAFGVTPLM